MLGLAPSFGAIQSIAALHEVGHLLFASVLLALLSAPPANASLLGDWITPNKSVVQIYPCGSLLCARIVHVDAAIGHSTDGVNPDAAKRNRPLCGLTIGTNFTQKDAAHAEGGKLYDPESGNTYSGTLTLASGTTLKLRGYIGISLFGRSETWQRAPSAPPACTS